MPRWLIALILGLAVLAPVSLRLATAQPMLIAPGGQDTPSSSPDTAADVPAAEAPVSPFTVSPPAVQSPPTSRPITPAAEPIVIDGPATSEPTSTVTSPSAVAPAPAPGLVTPEPQPTTPPAKSSLTRQQEIARQVGLRTTRRPTGNFIGVMGQIAQPGVFEYTTPFPFLIDVIRNAGGLTADASGSLRIVRQGRAGQQVYYSPMMRERLIPGDVVIVEGTSNGRAATHAPARARRLETAADTDHSAGKTEAVQIAFVNLIDRPVILKMRSEHATVSRIVGLLGQGPEVEQTVRVLKNGALQHRLTSSTALPDGSVLVFDPTVLVADRLPPLPGAYQPEGPAGDTDHVTSAEGTSGPVPAPQTNQPEAGATQQAPPHNGAAHGPVALDPESRRVTLLQPPTEGASINPAAPSTQSAESPARNFFRTAELPSLPQPARSEKGAVSSGIPAPADQNKAVATTPGVNPISLPQEVLPRQANADAASGKGGSSNGWAIVLCLMGCMTAVGSFVVFWSKTRTAEPLPAATIPIESAPEQRLASRLDALINNELPVTEEPVRLAGKLQFFGRPQSPRKIRIDQAHSFSNRDEAPAPAVQEQPQPAAQPEIAVGNDIPLRGMHRRPATAAAAQPAQAPTSQSAQQTVSENKSGLLGRALSTVHGASTR